VLGLTMPCVAPRYSKNEDTIELVPISPQMLPRHASASELLTYPEAAPQEWASPDGAPIALQCVVDLLGNACNADDPTRLLLVRASDVLMF